MIKISRLIAEIVCPQVFKDLDNAIKRKEKKDLEYRSLQLTNESLIIQNRDLIEKLDNANSIIINYEEPKVLDIESFCEKNFKEVPKFAYKNKGLYGDTKFSMYPNELIQPDIFLIKKLRDEIGSDESNIKVWTLKVGKYVDRRLKWTSDKDTTDNTDVYQNIYDTILNNKQDCEQHASLVSSIEPEIGIAFGMYKKKTGHAFNVFIHNDELWCLETNSVYDINTNARVFKYADQEDYDIHWIFTKDKTYRCKGKPLNFGTREK